jgi:eukaryotic-like serine/threonine-protein kinase
MSKCRSCGHQGEEEFHFCPTCGTRVDEGESGGDPLLGRVLNDKYRVVEEIGSGAMGTVYEGEHLGLRKKVALKVLHSDMQVSEDSLQRFQREGIAAGKFNHPGAIQIFDFDRDGQTIYLAMEFVEGVNLKVFLRQKGRLAPPAAVDVMVQVLSVLAEAHRQGIIHRDLKPDNIMVMPSATGQFAIKVLDFGLSKLVDARSDGSMQTQVGRILGTPLYMAPEQCAGEAVDLRSDLYAAGLIFYELLVGITPFPDESTTEILFTRTTREAPSVTDSHPDLRLSLDIDTILARALSRRRENRYQSAGEMLEALEAIRHDVVGKAGRRSESSAAPSRSSSTPLSASAADRPVAKESAPGERRWNWKRIAIAAAALILSAATVVAITDYFSGSAAPDVPRVTMKGREHWTMEESRYVNHLANARASLERGAPDIALAALDDALVLACADSEAFLLRAIAQRELGDLDMALADLAEALEIDPRYAEAAAMIGWIHFRGGDLEEASQRFDEAVGFDAGSGEALAGQAAVLLAHGDREEGKRFLESAVSVDSDSPAAHLGLGRLLLEEGDSEAAVGHLVAAKRQDSRNWRILAALGDAYLQRGDIAQAENQFEQARKLNGDAVEVLRSLASLLVDGERFSEARRLLESALGRHPTAGKLNALMGVVLEAQGDLDGALDRLQRALEAGEDDARLHTLMGVLHQRQGRIDDARRSFRAALSRDDQLALPHLDLGLLLFGEGDWEAAIPELTRAAELDPELEYPHLALGVIHMDYTGDSAAAVDCFSTYQERGGRDPRVEAWLQTLAQ